MGLAGEAGLSLSESLGWEILNRGKEKTHTSSSGIHSIDMQAGVLVGPAGPGSGHGVLGPTAGKMEPWHSHPQWLTAALGPHVCRLQEIA